MREENVLRATTTKMFHPTMPSSFMWLHDSILPDKHTHSPRYQWIIKSIQTSSEKKATNLLSVRLQYCSQQSLSLCSKISIKAWLIYHAISVYGYIKHATLWDNTANIPLNVKTLHTVRTNRQLAHPFNR